MTTSPPPVRREELVEQLHGHAVADPYRWLERPAGDPEVRAFVTAQNAASAEHLATLPGRDPFRARLRALWGHPRRGVPWRRGGWWFQRHNDGRQDQDVLWAAPVGDVAADVPPARAWRPLVDPNTWTADGTASLTGAVATHAGDRVAIGRSDAGSDWVTWSVVETATGRFHDDEVRWSKFGDAAWLPDGSAFVYTAYDPPEEGHEHAAAVRDQRLRLHRLGTPQGDDPVVHARPDQPEWGFFPEVSHDGRWLLLTVHRGTDPTTRVHVAPITDGTIGEIVPLLDEGDARYTPLGVLDGELVVVTDAGAPLGRVLAVDLADPARRRELVAEAPDRLEGAELLGAAGPDDPGWLVCRRLHHATARLDVHDPRSGAHADTLPLPGAVTVVAAAGGRHDHVLHLAVESFDRPVRIQRAVPADGSVTPVEDDRRDPDADDVVVEQVLVRHADVAVPLFVLHRPEVTPDGARPTVLWGYGGFDIPVTPTFRPAWRAWVDAGGVLAVACLRGGGEYGRTWHDDGRLANKQHVFDDALACAAWLTGRRRDRVTAEARTAGTDPDAVWSAPRHLGIEGRSNGGLLVGACITQEPDAFASAVPEVGVLDAIRFHRFTIGWAWTSDFGDPEDADDLAVLLRYSPYHRVRDGVAYPATLVTTGDTDDRVVPAHSYKFASALQRAQAGDTPILLRIDTSAGHGAGKPVHKLVEERADVLAFHAAHLGLRVTS